MEILYYRLGESIAIALALVGAEPVKEGTGRVVRFELKPLEELGRPRIDVLASLSGIFRVSINSFVAFSLSIIVRIKRKTNKKNFRILSQM